MSTQLWRRLGRVFCADRNSSWMTTHASYPTAISLGGAYARIFFSPRDDQNRSSIAYLDLRLSGDRFEITSISDHPLLTAGPRGAFDDSGVTISSMVVDGDRLLAYYLGWSLSVTVPFRNFIGLAVGSMRAPHLRRISPAPIVDRSSVDPYSLGYPWVLKEAPAWRMWYGSHLSWGAQGLEMLHIIKLATSADGVNWERDGRVAIGLAGGAEFAVSRPCVIRDPGGYRMWYSRRGPNYSLGYAESNDGMNWVRMDEQVVMCPPDAGWDSDTIEYAMVFDHGGRRYMLYNGNGYGRTGFGLAVLEP